MLDLSAQGIKAVARQVSVHLEVSFAVDHKHYNIKMSARSTRQPALSSVARWTRFGDVAFQVTKRRVSVTICIAAIAIGKIVACADAVGRTEIGLLSQGSVMG